MNFLSPRQSSKFLRAEGLNCPTYETIRALAIENKINAQRFQKFWMIDVDSLRQYLKKESDAKSQRAKPKTVGTRRRASKPSAPVVSP